MVDLNIPEQNIEIKSINSKNYIFDLIRKKHLVLTPEEWVRQNLVSYFINDLHYPKGLIKTESSLKYNNLKKRSDILIYNNDMTHYMIVECKSYKMKLNKSHLNQSAIYNKIYRSRYLMVSNGMEHIVCEYDWENETFKFRNSIPEFSN
ncbi:MAG: restriction endonuclease subunit R [Flammeovirgaceae bacterium]|mgnify:FL=1|nr:restriction endonuclease subunit R [Flammeovirgaceae bacterium]|tara:strand:- start:12713 stop:13159 length:447 start_codon:yes stop_codon:yes gene_type:complete